MRLACFIIAGLFAHSSLTAEDHFVRNVIEGAIVKAALAEGVSPVVLASICYNESTFQPQRVHLNDGGTNSYGLCQVKLAMARAMKYMGPVKGLLDASTNAVIAAKAMKYHQTRTRGSDETIAAYNAGRVIRKKDGQLVNIKYVQKVQSLHFSFHNLTSM
jgi:hypothetical protein